MRKTLQAYTAPSAICMRTPAAAIIHRLGVVVVRAWAVANAVGRRLIRVHLVGQEGNPQHSSIWGKKTDIAVSESQLGVAPATHSQRTFAVFSVSAPGLENACRHDGSRSTSSGSARKGRLI